MRQRRVLLAWEQGANFGHSVQLARLGRRLAAEGAQVSAAVRYLQNAGPLTDAGIRTLQAPPWPAPAPRPLDHVPASATITDSLARAGLRDPDSVRHVLRGWRAIIDAEQPDLMVCDYAPLAGLAARGRCAVMHAASAYCLPPSHLDAMPIFHTFAPPAHSDEEVVDAVNAALAAEGLQRIERIGGLFAGDDAFVCSFPIIDPYADLRIREAEGSLIDGEVREMEGDAQSIFAYLHAETVLRPDVTATLAEFAPRLEIYAPGVDTTRLAPLAAAGAKVHPRPVSMAETLARTRLLLHQGNAGVAADALLAGVPQYTLAVHVEHYLNGEALAAAGVSRNVPLFDPRVRIGAEGIRIMLEDEDSLAVAAAAGRMLRAQIARLSPLDALTGRCRALYP